MVFNIFERIHSWLFPAVPEADHTDQNLREIVRSKVFNNEEPVVCVWNGNDDPCRGDSRAYEGIGRAMASRLQGAYVYTCMPALELRQYFNEQGYPDIILGGKVCGEEILYDRDNRITFKAGGWNEGLARTYINDNAFSNPYGLLSHHITQQRLHDEGAEFDKYHAGQIKGELVMVGLVEQLEYGTESFQDKLIAMLADRPEATVYFCTSRRTSPEKFKDFLNLFETKIAEKKLQERVHVLSFDLNKARGLNAVDFYFKGYDQKGFYNPYIGLIAKADHLILYGQSGSMLSEMLMAGKSIMWFHALKDNPSVNMMKDGIVYDFAEMKAEDGLKSLPVNVQSVTDAVAEALLNAFMDKAYNFKFDPADALKGSVMYQNTLEKFILPLSAERGRLDAEIEKMLNNLANDNPCGVTKVKYGPHNCGLN